MFTNICYNNNITMDIYGYSANKNIGEGYVWICKCTHRPAKSL